MSGINAMPQYYTFFGMDGAGSGTGIIFAIYNIGSVCATPFGGPLNDRYGRRFGMLAGCLSVILGTCIAAPSKNMSMLLGGRFFLGMGSALCAIAAPTYASELAHPKYRGAMTGLYNVCWYVGSIVASWTTYGTSFLDGDQAFRIPMWLQMVTSGMVICALWFMPESPRWYMARNRHEDAKRVLTFYHGEGDPENVFVRLELAEMSHQIEVTGADKRWWDYRDLFRTKSARARMWCVMGMGWSGQYSGNAIVSYFFTEMMKVAGIANPHTQLLLNGLQPVFSLFASIIGALLTDKMGRRPPMIGAQLFGSLCFAVLTGCSKAAMDNHNQQAGYASIAFTYLFMIVFSFCYTPLQAMYIVECLPTETRAKGNAIGSLTSGVASVIGQYVAATAMGTIKYWYYLFFVFWDLIQATVIYFFFVETKNRTLEELNEVFNDPHPVKRSLQKRKADDIVHAII
jgi:sugar porter (SP) family MFS transporter